MCPPVRPSSLHRRIHANTFDSSASSNDAKLSLMACSTRAVSKHCRPHFGRHLLLSNPQLAGPVHPQITCSNAAAWASGSGQCHSPRSSAAAARIRCSSVADSAVCFSDALMIASTRRATVLASVESLHRHATAVKPARSFEQQRCPVLVRCACTSLHGSRCLLLLRSCLIMPQRQTHPEALIKV
jgi:hypothetical protein